MILADKFYIRPQERILICVIMALPFIFYPNHAPLTHLIPLPESDPDRCG